MVEVWAGPIFGSVLPIAIAGIASLVRLRVAYLFWVVTGFCLIANGAYIGIGAIRPVGDAQELVAHGMPRWSLAAFGLLALASGFWIWDRVSSRLGFGAMPAKISARHAYVVFAITALMTVLGIAFGNRGI